MKNISPPYNDCDTAPAAYLFDVLTHVAEVLKKAEKKRQAWSTDETMIADEHGNMTDGREIRIRIEPSKLSTADLPS